MKAETLADIKKVVEYLYEDEAKHFEENPYQKKEHIFNAVKRLKDLVERAGYCDSCGGKLTNLPDGQNLLNMNIVENNSVICLKCGVLHTNHVEELDEDEAENYRENYG